MSADIVKKLLEKVTVLTQERKRRRKTVPEELAKVEQIREWVPQSSYPGLLAVDLCADKTATVFIKDTEQVVAIMKGHQKKERPGGEAKDLGAPGLH
jgi:pre-mRNA-processing factor 19